MMFRQQAKRGSTASMRLGGARIAAGAACCWALASGAQAPLSVDAVIGPAACVADADCRTVAVGHKACGGPAAYRAWSLRGTDAQAVAAAAARSAQAPTVKGMSSDCAVVADPGARCVSRSAAAPAASSAPLTGRCELAPGSAVRGPALR